GEVKVWDAVADPEARTEHGPAQGVSFCLALDCESRRYAMLHGEFGASRKPRSLTFAVREVGAGRDLFRLPLDLDASGLPLTFSPGGRLLVGYSPGQVILWEGESGKVKGKRALPGNGGVGRPGPGLFPLAFTPDGKQLATARVRPLGDPKAAAGPRVAVE